MGQDLPARAPRTSAEYVLDHHQQGERSRLALMSRLLDPLHRRCLDDVGVGQGMRTLEVGCGNGSVSAWLADRVSPGGNAVAVDLDLSLGESGGPGLEYRQADILDGPVESAGFDLATARAVLHHIADAQAAVDNILASVRPGGAVLLIEPDFLPVSIAEPPEISAFWRGWLTWSRDQGINYFIGRRLAPMLAARGLSEVRGAAETALYNGGSPWARYWQDTVAELRPRLLDSGVLDNALIEQFLAQCDDPAWWTQTIAFTAVSGRIPAAGPT